MKRLCSLKIMLTLQSLVSCSLEEKIGSNWFQECLQREIGMSRSFEFDFMSSMIFLKKQVGMAVFSPLCSDINVLVQCIEGDFEARRIANAKNDLKFVIDHMKEVVSKSFNYLKCSYIRKNVMNYTLEHNEHLNKESPLFHTGHLLKENYKVLNDSNAKDILSKHNEWLKTASNGLLSTSLNPSTFLNNDKIYGSFIYFNDIWAKKFDTRSSYYDELRLSDDQTCLRKFMTRKDYFKYEKIKYDDLEYQIVVIPYKKTKNIHTRHMVYLIPLKNNADLSKIWDNFYTVSEGNIRSYITKLDFNLIDLHIPSVEHIQSSFNLIDLIYDVFRYNISYNIHSSMVVYLNVDGNGGEENGPIMDNTTDESIEIPYVKANVPHISFIYDDDCKRILFITKDG